MKFNILILLSLLVVTNTFSQSDTSNIREATPKESINEIYIKFLDIEFTDVQYDSIKGKEIELYILVNEIGQTTLTRIGGLKDPIIKDSLRIKFQELKPFNPTLVDGIPQSAVYLLSLTYPDFDKASFKEHLVYGKPFSESKMEDFERIELSKFRTNMTADLISNTPIGNLSNHISTGYGFGLNLNFSPRGKMNYGLNLSGYSHKLIKAFPSEITRTQENPSTVNLGISVGRWIRNINIRSDINYMVQHFFTITDSDKSKDFRNSGWSAGLIFAYPIALVKDKPTLNSGVPALSSHNISLNLGIRAANLSMPSTSGIFFEFGISYSFIADNLKDFKFTEKAIREYNKSLSE